MLSTLFIRLKKKKDDEDLDADSFGSENMLSSLGHKICRQFRFGRYAGNFGSENMPASSGPKICQQFWVGKKCRQCRIGTKRWRIQAAKKKCLQVWAEKNASVFRREQNCLESGICRRTYRSVKKLFVQE